MANGILVINKPERWTSMDVCAKLRGVFHEKRIGHAGTLDPMATGVLPVFVGRATRAVQFAETGEKEYQALLRLGLTTNTQDVWGETLAERPVPPDAKERLEAILPQFMGEIRQIPPMYSAVKIQGKKLYELARKGVEVERKPRPVTIYALEAAQMGERASETARPDACGDISLRVRCSKGTYIRTLCHDIGQALGCGGCMAGLRRTEACGFQLSEALPLEAVVQADDPAAFLRPVDSCFYQYDGAELRGKALSRARNGNPFPWEGPDGTYRFYAPDGEFLLLGECRQGQVTIIKSFYEV